ncbi:MAG: nitrogen fixation negative regulator NifL [Burkholderiales bacterium]|nr:nitrogen fixation negative regulator NifL [Burkholderiales bacterium]
MDAPNRLQEVPDLPLEAFRLAVEQAALAISITDTEARILYANPAFERVTGYSAGEVLGHKESILSYKVTPAIVYETMWAQLLRQRTWNGLLVNRRKDGSRYLAELTITPVVNADGVTTHYLGLHRDVTDMHRLERQVQNQKALIESVVDAVEAAIVLLDEQDKVVLDNQGYKKLIGELGPEPAHPLLAALRERLGPGLGRPRDFSQIEVQIETARREPRWFSCAGAWIEEQDASADAFYEARRRRYLLLTVQDITSFKAQQEAIRLNGLRALLAEQERIQSLREALSGAVYQLQGPINRLAAAVRMLERRQERDSCRTDPLMANLEEALRSGNQALQTLQDCIPEADEGVQSVDLNELLQDLLHIATPDLLSEGIVVEWQPAPGLPAIAGRRQQLSNLFKQLLDNAVEAIHESRRPRRELKVATHAHPDRVEVIIEDSGPGIPEEWRFKVFEPFFTTKGAEDRHIGMGLTVAQEVVAGHGGLIEIDPSCGEGCRVRVQLPRG